MKSLYVLAAGLMLLLGVGIGHGLSQDRENPAESEKSDAEMEKWKELHKPGEQHAWLKESVGDWKVSAKMWKEPGAAPTQTTGNSRLQMVFDRYLYEELSVGQGDEIHEARGFIGFDNSNEEFNALYVGNMGTDMCVISGDRTGNVVDLAGEKKLGDTTVKQRVTYAREAENRIVVTIFATLGDEPERRMMELTYTR